MAQRYRKGKTETGNPGKNSAVPKQPGMTVKRRDRTPKNLMVTKWRPIRLNARSTAISVNVNKVANNTN
jgi:hypothetical protein